MSVIGLCGCKGSGKDTVAEILSIDKNYHPVSFASTVKDVVSIVFNYDRNMLDGTTIESRLWREEVDHWWANKLNIENFTPRLSLTLIGTDVMREYISKDIWILNLNRKVDKLLAEGKKVIITDIRYSNEFNMVKDIMGGKVYRVLRDTHYWFDMGLKASQGNAKAIQYMKDNDIHESEWDYFKELVNIDGTIDNTGDLDILRHSINNVIP